MAVALPVLSYIQMVRAKPDMPELSIETSWLDQIEAKAAKPIGRRRGAVLPIFTSGRRPPGASSTLP